MMQMTMMMKIYTNDEDDDTRVDGKISELMIMIMMMAMMTMMMMVMTMTMTMMTMMTMMAMMAMTIKIIQMMKMRKPGLTARCQRASASTTTGRPRSFVIMIL